jgi:hypothetical protein
MKIHVTAFGLIRKVTSPEGGLIRGVTSLEGGLLRRVAL